MFCSETDKNKAITTQDYNGNQKKSMMKILSGYELFSLGCSGWALLNNSHSSTTLPSAKRQ